LSEARSASALQIASTAMRKPARMPFKVRAVFAAGITFFRYRARGRSEDPAMQSDTSTTFVLVHGAWSGGWCYARVAALLRSRGHTAFTPTLTGQGERAHLSSGAVNLSTHIEDVLGVFRFERLDNVVLAGHSHGGMVVTGVADRIAEKIKALAYLDAFVPEDGQSLFDVIPANT
jgi:pimeloyl-ACP methyl ester carboxylesterase